MTQLVTASNINLLSNLKIDVINNQLTENNVQFLKNIMEKAAKNINKYLGNFKDAKGNQPDQVKVAVLVEQYCNAYTNYHKNK